MEHILSFESFVNEAEVWSGSVEPKFHPEPGIFTKDPETLAKYLKTNSKDLRQAMSRLLFYINRAGKNIKPEDKERLEKAKTALRNLYES